MRIAVVGTGISGMLAANLLSADHELTVYEAGSYIGGHTHTVRVEVEGTTQAVDTGFIVYNEKTYPNFTRLLKKLKVSTRPTTMSFSVKCERTGLEYNGTSLNTLFAQRRNLLRPSFYQMIRDILKFYRNAKTYLSGKDTDLGLGDFLKVGEYGQNFIDQHIVPMASAIWSADPAIVADMPLRFFLEFFDNHGFLDVDERPQWRVIDGGSSEYMERLTAHFRERIRLNTPVRSISRDRDGVEISTADGDVDRYDAVILATHSDQALRLLADPTVQEREILGAIPYQDNDVVLHGDTSLLPRARRAWAAWNYHLLSQPPKRSVVTYNMNLLQSLESPETLCVTLNRSESIDPKKILKRFTYHHPVFTMAAVKAQKRHSEINGRNRTYYCGAYWGYGFHEDGVNSALSVARHFGKDLSSCEVRSTREASATGV